VHALADLQAPSQFPSRGFKSCRRLHEISQSPKVQYSILLDVCDMQDGGGRPDVPVIEKLRRLQAYELAWRSLSLTECLTIDVSSGAIPCKPKDGFCAVFSISQPDRHTVITIHQLPSPLRGIMHRSWSWTYPVTSSWLDIEPAQDLAMIFEEPAVLAQLRSFLARIVRALTDLQTSYSNAAAEHACVPSETFNGSASPACQCCPFRNTPSQVFSLSAARN